MNKNNIISGAIMVLIVAVIAGAIVYFGTPKSKYSQAQLVGLAEALASSTITMYGAEWCPHCQAQKVLFGPAFEYVPYVECPNNEKLCLAKGIQGYPTWLTKDGTKYVGEQTLEKLAEVAGYNLGK